VNNIPSGWSEYAHTIAMQRYAHDMGLEKESWSLVARRVSEAVMGAVNAPRDVVDAIAELIDQRIFLPGGRYLYAAGRPLHQTQNCLLTRCKDTREGWADHLHKHVMGLGTGAGMGTTYSALREAGAVLKRTGGIASGPLPLMVATNEVGRGMRQGGTRRSALWAGLHWWHPDNPAFLKSKNWSEEVRRLKAKDYDFPAALDQTNISNALDDMFFEAYHNPDFMGRTPVYHDAHHGYAVTHKMAQDSYWTTIRQMLETAEPGFSVDVGENAGEDLRNAPLCKETSVLTSEGYREISQIIGIPSTVWTGKQWASDVVFRETNPAARIVRVSFTGGRTIRCDAGHPFLVEGKDYPSTIDRIPASYLMVGDILHVSLPPVVRSGASPREIAEYNFHHLEHGNLTGPSMIKVESVEEDGVEAVYCADVKVAEHSFQAEGVIVSNCTEVTSRDDNDICNIGSINMARITSLSQMRSVVELATMFLIAGSVYSHLPYPGVSIIREKNRRLGLGLMGIHEWLLKNGKKYSPDLELGKYLEIYRDTSTLTAQVYADFLGISRPVKVRAIAPNGTIGIVAQTTQGIEPILYVACKRQYFNGSTRHYQYVIDPCAKKLIDEGMRPEDIETAYSLASSMEGIEQRVAFQAWVQTYVDHGISSTINLPEWGSPQNNEDTVKPFGEMLIKYLPKLRGITVYPDMARGGQPFTQVPYERAIRDLGKEFSDTIVQQGDVCEITKGGTCGS